jgi:hypothetical protein
MSGNGDDLEALLGLSVEVAKTMKEAAVEAAKERHPSGKAVSPLDAVTAPGSVVLNHGDRCDHCGVAAVYRVADSKAQNRVLDFCLHAFRKHFPPMANQGWAVIGGNTSLLQTLGEDRLKGDDHA